MKTMRKGLLADSPPITQLIMAVLTIIACGVLLMFVGILFTPLVTGVSLTEMVQLMNSGEAGNKLALMRYLQTLQGICMFIVPALLLGYFFSGNVAGYFGFCNRTPPRVLLIAAGVMVAAIPTINMLATLNEMIVFPERLSALEQKLQSLEEAARVATELFLNVDSAGGMLFNLLMIAVIPALGEELIFRGVLQKILTRWMGNVHVAVVVTGLLFSLMHMQFYGFFPRWLLGVLFGYMLVWTGSIWVPVLAHFTNNALAVVVSYLTRKGDIPERVEDYGGAWSDVPVTIIAAAICAWLLWNMYRKTKQTTQTTIDGMTG